MLECMHEIGNIRTFEDQEFLRGICRASYAVLSAGAIGGVALFGFCGIPCELASSLVGGFGGVALWVACVVLAILLSFASHEVVHALFFKALGPRGARVTFGWNLESAMIYACAEGIVYSRRRYLAVVLAPTVVVTGVVVALGTLFGCGLTAWVVCVLHLSGCTGDWFYARAVMFDRRIRWCEDTAWGVCFYDANEDGENEGA